MGIRAGFGGLMRGLALALGPLMLALLPPAGAEQVGAPPAPRALDRAALIVPGYDHGLPGNRPPAGAAGDQGAFRFICAPGHLNHDDPILYPGVRGGSPHLHQWYGNLRGDHRSNYETLRREGDSSCSNALNRSAYWVPALVNAAGKVISFDYASVYYKREPDGSPLCALIAREGCAALPTGLRAVSGYDMNRMGKPQPENMTFGFRCISHQVDRRTIMEAVADCGGAGQVMAGVQFGPCWNGELDSPDHRSHLAAPRYQGQAYPECPRTHRKLIPTLTQQVAYTITREDGEVHFASDRMGGMAMPGGATFHADYMEAWDPATRDTWMRLCIGRRLNCADGELGDGTMLKRGPLPLRAAPRLLEAPGR